VRAGFNWIGSKGDFGFHHWKQKEDLLMIVGMESAADVITGRSPGIQNQVLRNISDDH
jgi:hypothetical protein